MAVITPNGTFKDAMIPHRNRTSIQKSAVESVFVPWVSYNVGGVGIDTNAPKTGGCPDIPLVGQWWPR